MASKNDLKSLESRKLELVAKVRELRAEVAKVNLELHQAGAKLSDVVCW